MISTSAGGRRPNVLLIMSDEQTYGTLGCTGNPAARTPNLDALAERGRNHHGIYTPFPLCCPSRTSLMTGLMPRHHHVPGNWRGIRPDLRSTGLGRWFADAGYHTFYVGKWHVPGTDPATMRFADQAAIPAVQNGKDRGRYIPDYRDYATEQGYRLLTDNIENLTAADLTGLRDRNAPHRTTAEIDVQHHLEPWQTRQFGSTLASAPDDRPWFGYCSFNAPHFPFAVPAPYDQMIDRSKISLPDSWHTGFGRLPAEVRNSKFAQAFTDLDEQGWIEVVGHYYGMISMIDDQIGTICELLRSRGELDRRIIVFTSDHGDMMGAHRLMQKGHLLHYEEAVHVPLIISHPDGDSKDDHRLHSMIDLTPTLFDLAGLPAPNAEIDGVGFAGSTPGRDRVFCETMLWDRDSENAHGEHRDPAGFRLGPDSVNLSVRDRQYRYIFRSADIDELYDRTSDPGETINLARSRPDLTRHYRGQLAAEIGDTFDSVGSTLIDSTTH